METKLISWNVNGLRAVCGKGFADIFADFDADYVCLQETKLQQGQIDLEFPGYTSYWNYAEKKGYSGVAVYTRRQPLAVHLGIGRDEHDREGRVITLEDKDFYLVCCYRIQKRPGICPKGWTTGWNGKTHSGTMSADFTPRGCPGW